MAAALAEQCYCDALPGGLCRRRNGVPTTRMHTFRYAAAWRRANGWDHGFYQDGEYRRGGPRRAIDAQ